MGLRPEIFLLWHFYPRPPRGGRHGKKDQGRQRQSISIHALREEGDHRHASGCFVHKVISIHALREEGDCCCKQTLREPAKISIHALREEGDGYYSVSGPNPIKFLSTPSARRATRFNTTVLLYVKFLSTPSARRATEPDRQRP